LPSLDSIIVLKFPLHPSIKVIMFLKLSIVF